VAPRASVTKPEIRSMYLVLDRRAGLSGLVVAAFAHPLATALVASAAGLFATLLAAMYGIVLDGSL
jgi:hypothetical protein